MTDAMTVSARKPLELTRSHAAMMDMYAAHRLAEMNGVEAWVYRRYRRLPPRGRMVIGELGFFLLVYFATYGALILLFERRETSVFPLVGLAIGVALRAIFRPVPFRYQ